MRKISGRLLITAASVMLAGAAGIPAAQAQTSVSSQLCGNGGSGYCMNAWNGGPTVKMYNGGVTNEDFTYRDVNVCNGKNKVESNTAPYHDGANCPFTNTGIDNQLRGATIVELEDLNNDECVGTGDINSQQDIGYLGSCGNSSGVGAIDGAFDVIGFETPDGNGSCPIGNFLVNRYWTNTYGTNQLAFVQSGGNPNTYLFVGSIPPFDTEPTCWG